MQQELTKDTLDFFLYNPTISHLVKALICDPDNDAILPALVSYCDRRGLQEHSKKITDFWETFKEQLKKDREGKNEDRDATEESLVVA